MESKLNIPSTIEDSSYRYKMPQMILKTEGKNQNTKTVITNIVELAKSLNINTEYPIKFIAIEFGVRPIFEINNGEVYGAIMGKRTYEDILKFLDKFIEKYVCCPKCKLPELHLRIRGDKKRGEIHGKCESCGFKGAMDQNHKIINTMLDQKPIKWGIELEKKNDKKKEKDEDDQKDSSKKDDKKKKKDADKTLKGDDLLPKSEALQKYIQNAKEIYQKYIVKKEGEQKDEIKEKDHLVEDLFHCLGEIPLESKNSNRYFFVIFQAIFDINIAHEVNLNAFILKKIASKYALDLDSETILNFQYLCYIKFQRETFQQFIPTITKFFYDEDLIQEKFLLAWNQQIEKEKVEEFFKQHFLLNCDVNSQFQADSKSFLDWLQQADEEDEEEEEEEKIE